MIGGAWLALVSPLIVQAHMPIGLIVFMLLFPLVAVAAILVALTTATMTYDRSGWTFSRALLGHVREQETGAWVQVAGTNYAQWYVSGGRSGGGTLFGELQLYGANGAIVLRARTAFFVQGNPTARHTAGKRQIGLQPEMFDKFVRLIDRETPQLAYVWRRVDVDPDAKFGGFMSRPGPPHYVRVRRGEEMAPEDAAWSGEPLQEAAATEDGTLDDSGFHPPVWRGEVPRG